MCDCAECRAKRESSKSFSDKVADKVVQKAVSYGVKQVAITAAGAVSPALGVVAAVAAELFD